MSKLVYLLNTKTNIQKKNHFKNTQPNGTYVDARVLRPQIGHWARQDKCYAKLYIHSYCRARFASLRKLLSLKRCASQILSWCTMYISDAFTYLRDTHGQCPLHTDQMISMRSRVVQANGWTTVKEKRYLFELEQPQ